MFANAKIGSTERQTDGGTKSIRQIGVIEIDRDEVEVKGTGGGGEGAGSLKKKPRSAVRSCVVRGTLLCEPATAVSGTASLHVIRHRVSGSSPSHFVPPLTASRPDCLTASEKKRRQEEER